MQQLGLRGKGSRRRQPRTTQSNPDHRFEPNVLQQHFDTAQPDAVWLTDITYIPTDEGYLYVAGVMDLYTRQIVGLSMASHLPSELTEAALHMALTQRQPSGPLIHHSDRGSQYTSDDYRNLLRAHPIVEGRKQSVEGITFSFEFDHLRADEDIEFSCHGLPQHK